MKTGTRLAAATIGCVMLILGLSLPAQAHDRRAYLYACGSERQDLCGYGQVRYYHQIVDACDTRADGHGLYVRYRLLGGSEGKVGDANGSAAGCGIQFVGSASVPIIQFNVCVDLWWETDPCTGWVWS